jgi:hypothetical protein
MMLYTRKFNIALNSEKELLAFQKNQTFVFTLKTQQNSFQTLQIICAR